MFKTAELGQSISTQTFKKREPLLREQLLNLQARLRAANQFPVLIDFAGVSGAGKGTSTNMLNKWMDGRYIQTQGYSEPLNNELQRPELWRFWRDLPARGHIGISLSGRYSRPILDFVYDRISRAVFMQKLERIKQFEKTLADDGALILKFWMHISREVQEERLRALEEDPLQKWKLAADDWENWQHYDRFIETAELIISHTTSGHAPWIIVEGEDFNYRSLTVGEAFRDALEQQLTKMELSKQFATELNNRLEQGNDKKKDKHNVPQATLFDSLNLKHKLAKSSYNKKLTEHQSRLAGLYQTAIHQGLSTVLVFEGPDASGKGGAIRRVTEALDARTYSIHPIAAPTEEELAHHYLWRFWRHLPRSGRMTIFDRSWYGRVLVERLEGFATINEWQRAYAEINEFEDQLLKNGTVLLKFWLHTSKEEQARRFNARKEIPWKKWKLTDEDWRNHKKWREYEVAAHDMIQMTSMHAAPWKVIEGQDKYWGRIRILESVCDTLEKAIGKQA